MNWKRFVGVAAIASSSLTAACAEDERATERTAAVAQAVTSGPCNFAPPPTPGTPTNRTFTIKVPNGTTRDEFALSTAGGVLTVNDAVLALRPEVSRTPGAQLAAPSHTSTPLQTLPSEQLVPAGTGS
jgi:hypothetical protein